MLIEIKPAQSLSEIVRKLKTSSLKWIHKTYPNLKDFAGQSGCSVFSVSPAALLTVVRYIENQKEHHKQLPFSEELKLFFERRRVRFDPERYLD